MRWFPAVLLVAAAFLAGPGTESVAAHELARAGGQDSARDGERFPRASMGAAGAGAAASVGTGAVPASVSLSASAFASAGARSLCSGRPVRTVRFATGELRVYRSGRSACAVTIAKKPGPRRAMLVSLQARGSRAVVIQGTFRRHAGPVRVSAVNRCVRAYGSIAGIGRSTGWISC
ncbi:hypothetical protein [Streptomyces sp. NPDC004726]